MGAGLVLREKVGWLAGVHRGSFGVGAKVFAFWICGIDLDLLVRQA